MPISRPFLIALLGAVLLGASFLAVQSVRNNSGDDAAPAAQQPAGEQQAADPAPAASPEELLRSAFKGGDIDSTAFSARLSIDVQGQRGSVAISGAFERGAVNDVPEVEVSAEVSAPGLQVEGGFVSLGDEAYFTQGNAGWRVPGEVWAPVVGAVAKGAAAQPQSLPLPVDPQSWLRSVESEGTETIDGAETTHVSATLDPERAVQDLLDAVRAAGRPVPDAADLEKAVESAEFDAWIGTTDRVVRRLEAGVAFAEAGELSLDLELSGVNQPQDIKAPAKVQPGVPDGLFGQFAQGMMAGISGTVSGQPLSAAALNSRNPQRAARAVADSQKVVILFQNPDGLDDREMRKVMRRLDARTRAVVLTDHVDAVDRYGSMVEDLGVSQTPAVVLIDRTGEARLIEGYVDTDTLAQAVADAR
jgi:hypothetical protein